uniref:Anaphase-promoting complex subunit 4 WD40 domain-containing protein n=1 Tax=Zooxanthella nutricula TaxID=1333877 RepID=A0A7S2QCF5_9DINO
MQVGLAWPSAGAVLTVCLDGRVLLWEVAADGSLKLAATVDGTQGPINCVACDGPSGTMLHAGGDGTVLLTPPSGLHLKAKVGKGVNHILAHSAAWSGPAQAWVCSLDDCARLVSLETGAFVGSPVEIKQFVVGAAWADAAETQALLATSKGGLVCLCESGIEWTKDNLVPRRPTAVACSGAIGRVAIALERPDGSVGGVQSSQFEVQLFAISGSADSVTFQASLQEHAHEVTALRFSPSGEFLASADAGSKILVWKVSADGAAVAVRDFCNHTARVTCLDWLASGRRLVSGSIDSHVFVWDVDQPKNKVQLSEAHKGGVSSVAACGDKGFASVGQDGFLQIRELE